MKSVLGGRIEGVPHFDVAVNPQKLDNVCVPMIKQIKGDWKADELCMKEFSGGISNKLVGYYTAGSIAQPPLYHGGKPRSDLVLVRMYGENTDLIIDREQELHNIKQLSLNDIAPQLYATFNNGYCYGFLEGTVCTPASFTDPNILRQSAHLMAKFHSIQLSSDYLERYPMKANIFEKTRQYINIMPRSFACPKQQQRFVESVPAPDKLHAELDLLEERASGLKHLPVSFCHNDMLVANYLYDETRGVLCVIDYEYGQPNYSAYDLGNHFDEFAGVDTVDYNLYPSKEVQLEFIRTYLEKLNELKGGGVDGSEEAVEQWYKNVELMSLVSHMFWGVWAQIQAANSSIDFDFLGYGVIRLNEYFRRKSQVIRN